MSKRAKKSASRAEPAKPQPAAVPSRRIWLFRGLAVGVPALVAMAGVVGWMIHHGRLEIDVNKMSIAVKDEPIILYDQFYKTTGMRYLFDPQLGWRNVPNQRGKSFSLPMTTNAHGLRGPERDFEKPAGVQRVLMLGDSFAWGYAVGDDDVCATQLEKWLATKAAPVEVLNSAVSGWATDQEYLYLRDEGFRYSPDVVVLMFYTVNDFLENLQSSQHGHSKPLFLDTNLTPAGQPVPKPGTAAPSLQSKAHPVDLACAIVDEIAAECHKHGTRLVIMTFGTIFFPNDAELTDFTSRFAKHVAQMKEVEHLDFDAACKSRNLKGEELYAGNPGGHWNPAAHQLAAQTLGQFLLEKKLIFHPPPQATTTNVRKN